MSNNFVKPDELIAYILQKSQGLPEGKRFILGIVGYPGAGKSTTANYLAAALNRLNGDEGALAVVVPMDGFHRYNAELRKLNLFELKGVPDSFDGQAFVDLLRTIRSRGDISIGCPCFDRAIEEPTPDAIQVMPLPQHKIVIVEGNYLLLSEAPWDQIASILDECWFVESDRALIEERLLQRHIAGGRDPAAARAKMESTDLPNADLINASKGRAQRIIAMPPLDRCGD